MGGEGSREVRYTAFLSYSHKDAAAAGRLHRRLETYRMPRRLAGSEGAYGPVPGRLSPIFRDREELPAATDLSETVREALGQSGALIILCSAHAAASLWVAEEIETFRRLHPDRPVLAAVLDGDPPDCFPKALRAFGRDGTWHEPLATDLRPHRDGARLGLLKLVAGITGVGLDALVQRDAARRVRRVTAVTAGAVAMMLVMAALALAAVSARREAERQRAEAEGQIEFMLTDLRARLRGSVGELDIMTTVNRHALAYYGQQDLGGLPADSRARRARILHAIGEDYLTRGNLPAALAVFEDAHRTTASLLADAPDDPERILNDGQSEYWIGSVYEQRQNWPEARLHYANYAAAAERLISIAPHNPDYMLEMAWGASNRGVVQRDGDHDYAAARASFEAAVRWFEKAIRARPRDSDRRDLANAYGNLADCFHRGGHLREALAARLRAYQITAPLSRASPSDFDLTYRLAIAERAVAHESILAGDRGPAPPFMLRAYNRARLLTAHDPHNAEWLMFRTLVECDLVSRTLAIRTSLDPGTLRRSINRAAVILHPEENSRLEPCLQGIRPSA